MKNSSDMGVWIGEVITAVFGLITTILLIVFPPYGTVGAWIIVSLTDILAVSMIVIHILANLAAKDHEEDEQMLQELSLKIAADDSEEDSVVENKEIK